MYLSALTLTRPSRATWSWMLKATCVMQLRCHPGLDRWVSLCHDDSVDCTHRRAGPDTGAALGLRWDLGSQRRSLTMGLLSCFLFAVMMFGVCDNGASGPLII